ncbi:MAG: putative glycoside hydrolase, partial [Pseudomonadota bacterium]
RGADDIGQQCGGWTLSWQGTGNDNEHFPNGVSIYEGIRRAVEAGGGRAMLSADGRYAARPDAAVVVFGEEPYAEFQGDRPSIDYGAEDGLALLRAFRAEGIPTVAVFLSGRPLWVNPELNAADAFVAAFLPGTAGDGVADVLIADAKGEPRYDFRGRLSFSWPGRATDVDLNVGDADYNPLFAYGYGLDYTRPTQLAALSEDAGLDPNAQADPGDFLRYGDPVGQWGMFLRDADGNAWVGGSRGTSASGALTVRPSDVDVQEDTLHAVWTAPGHLSVEGPAADFSRHFNADLVLALEYRIVDVENAGLWIGLGDGEVDVTASARAAAGAGWRTSELRLACFADAPAALSAVSAPLSIRASGPASLQLKSARLAANSGRADCAL